MDLWLLSIFSFENNDFIGIFVTFVYLLGNEFIGGVCGYCLYYYNILTQNCKLFGTGHLSSLMVWITPDQFKAFRFETCTRPSYNNKLRYSKIPLFYKLYIKWGILKVISKV